MADRIGPERNGFAVGVVGGPTTVIDIGGTRFVADPTFDPPGEKAYLTKLRGPAVPAEELGAVDAVLVSHDLHLDNLDESGRQFALAAPVLLVGPRAATRLGPPATGLANWESTKVPRGDGAGDLTVQAVPAMHGPADGTRDEDGNVNCEVTGFVISGDDLPTVYVSGDNASIAVVAEVARRIGRIDVAVLFAGGARVSIRESGRPLTLTSERAAAAAAVLAAPVVVPSHYDGWAHFTEGSERIVEAFEDAGLSKVLLMAPLGEWVRP
ncbi:MAG TPA: MBL fold metallo-hydrolase [Pseudonocardia sp.]|jgi:L-ascorbate metabolism protein UlaG (beta-lactamase superfamily)|nr:MBL fold metallo-hydrolase [Pseudonocardia sp.]